MLIDVERLACVSEDVVLTIPGTDPLANAVAKPLRIHFYIDGYHSYLLSKEVEGLHRAFLGSVLKDFPDHIPLFDLTVSPKKRAALVMKFLNFAEAIVIARHEARLSNAGLDVIPHTKVIVLKSPFRRTRPLYQGEESFYSTGKTYVEASSYGVVFCPRYNRAQMDAQVKEYIDTLSVESDFYELVIEQLRATQQRLRGGEFERTQAFYDFLADEVGDVSQRGFLKISQNIRRKVVEEKGVDGDMIAALAADAYTGAADAFVLMTNDADHAPLAGRLVEEGRDVLVIGYAPKPAGALRNAVGVENVINLLTDEREFDFDPIWLKEEDPHSLAVLQDMEMHWRWWKSKGLL